ncbi:UPF0057 membrane protein F47B7.1 [Aphelenchoides besseyi]|nr:UPF0057 membrane protein F47B7.1 [Aphelenchoides besseyi]KAI6219965.1 UPF0057 membrane protein F47B7.1 [Aphelenchoides besseyi]
MAITIQQIIEIILCVLLPPLAVFMLRRFPLILSYSMHANDCNVHVLVSIVLCLIAWIPGVIHAIWYCFFNQREVVVVT